MTMLNKLSNVLSDLFCHVHQVLVFSSQSKKYSDFLYNLGGIVKQYNLMADTIDVLTVSLLRTLLK